MVINLLTSYSLIEKNGTIIKRTPIYNKCIINEDLYSELTKINHEIKLCFESVKTIDELKDKIDLIILNYFPLSETYYPFLKEYANKNCKNFITLTSNKQHQKKLSKK